MGIFDFRDPSKRKKKKQSISIECDSKEVRINGTVVSFPTSYTNLQEILGEANRIVPFKQTGIDVYLWDDLGIYCSMPDPNNILMLMLILDNAHDLGHQPRKNFTSDLIIDGVVVENDLPNINQDRPYIVKSIKKGLKVVAIAIGWNSRV